MVGDVAEYVVVTRYPLYQERIVHMGWTPEGGDSFVKRFAAPPDIVRIHANFSRHLEAMVRQSARLDPVPWESALAEFAKRVSGSSVKWWLYGSAALAVRGLDVSPGDLDISVDDAHAVADLLRDLLVDPVTHMPNWVAECGAGAFHGALIEWLAGPKPEFEPHEQGLAAAERLETIVWQGHEIHVPPLDLQLEVARRRGATDTVAKIEAALAP